jgi:hypothetical protein
MRCRAPTTSPPAHGYVLYDARGRPFTLNLGKISGDRVKCSCSFPRSGDAMDASQFDNKGTRFRRFFGRRKRWVLIVDDASKGYQLPVRTAARA